MSRHTAEVVWERAGQDFLDNRYSRKHAWRFDGGTEVLASSSPHVVPPPFSDASAVDPEEAFIASLSSCHMLWFLSIAVRHGFRVDRYRDAAEGVMERNAQGKSMISMVTLKPHVIFSGERLPSRSEIVRMHHEAHEECFIANSVRTEIYCEPVYDGF